MLPRISSALIAKITPLKSESGHESGQAAFSETTSKQSGGDPSHQKHPGEEAKIIPFPTAEKSEEAPAISPGPAVTSPLPSGAAPIKASLPLGEVFLQLLQWVHQAVRPFSRVSGVEAYFHALTRGRKGARFKKGTLVDRAVD